MDRLEELAKLMQFLKQYKKHTFVNILQGLLRDNINFYNYIQGVKNEARGNEEGNKDSINNGSDGEGVGIGTTVHTERYSNPENSPTAVHVGESKE